MQTFLYHFCQCKVPKEFLFMLILCLVNNHMPITFFDVFYPYFTPELFTRYQLIVIDIFLKKNIVRLLLFMHDHAVLE